MTVKRFHRNGKGESKKFHDIIDHLVALPIPDFDIYYTLFALLFHYGKTLERGHYTAHFLSGDSWISAHDKNINEVVNTPEYPGTGGHQCFWAGWLDTHTTPYLVAAGIYLLFCNITGHFLPDETG